MIVLLDTSSPVCRLTLIHGDKKVDYSWQADRTLARDLLKYLKHKLTENSRDFTDIEAIGLMKGPGSFTGLRIGAAVANTLAGELKIPIVGTSGEDWQARALRQLGNDESDEIVLPDYGRPARITTPKK